MYYLCYSLLQEHQLFSSSKTKQQKSMENHISREAAAELLKKYNKDAFHLHHALTVEGVMRWYAEQLGYASEVDFWGMVGAAARHRL